MPNSYTGSPSTNDIDRVRFFINDKAAPFFLTDEEIMFLIEEAGNADSAAADAADMIAGHLSTKADKTVGPLSIRYSDQAQSYALLATRLRSRAARGGGGPILTQTDRGPLFWIGMSDGGALRPWSATDNVGDTDPDLLGAFEEGMD